MGYRINFTPESGADLDEIAEDLVERTQSKAASLSVLRLIRQRISMLRDMPGTGRIFEKNPRLRCAIVRNYQFSYSIFYAVDEESRTVSIVRILHGARNIDRILAAANASASEREEDER